MSSSSSSHGCREFVKFLENRSETSGSDNEVDSGVYNEVTKTVNHLIAKVEGLEVSKKKLEDHKALVEKTKLKVVSRKLDLKEAVEEGHARLSVMAEKLREKRKEKEALANIIGVCEATRRL